MAVFRELMLLLKGRDIFYFSLVKILLMMDDGVSRASEISGG